MNSAPPCPQLPSGLLPSQPTPIRLDRLRKPPSGETLGIIWPGRSAEDCGGDLQNRTEVATWRAVPRTAPRGRFRLRPTAQLFVQVGLSMS